MKKPLLTGILVAIVAFVVYCVIEDWCIRYSSSSTAAIGYIFLPFVAFIQAIPFFVLGFCAHYGVVKLRQHARIGYLFATIAVILGTLYIGGYSYDLALWTATNNVRAMPQSQHDAFLNNSVWRTNKYVLGALPGCR